MVWLGLMSLTAAASTVHELRFSQPAKVLVWQSGEFIGQGPEVSVLASLDTAPPDLLGSGELLFSVNQETNVARKVEFSVASNSGFLIKSDDPRFADDVQVRIVGVGANAASAVTLADRGAGVIYHQASKTAYRPGGPETQALRFEVSWTTDTPPNLDVIALAP